MEKGMDADSTTDGRQKASEKNLQKQRRGVDIEGGVAAEGKRIEESESERASGG